MSWGAPCGLEHPLADLLSPLLGGCDVLEGLHQRVAVFLVGLGVDVEEPGLFLGEAVLLDELGYIISDVTERAFEEQPVEADLDPPVLGLVLLGDVEVEDRLELVLTFRLRCRRR